MRRPFREPPRSVHFRNYLGSSEGKSGDSELLAHNSVGGFEGSFAKDEVRRWEHPALAMNLGTPGVESPDVIPRSGRIHAAHEHLARFPFWAHEDEGREAEPFGWYLGHAERGRVRVTVEATEPAISGHVRYRVPARG